LIDNAAVDLKFLTFITSKFPIHMKKGMTIAQFTSVPLKP